MKITIPGADLREIRERERKKGKEGAKWPLQKKKKKKKNRIKHTDRAAPSIPFFYFCFFFQGR